MCVHCYRRKMFCKLSWLRICICLWDPKGITSHTHTHTHTCTHTHAHTGLVDLLEATSPSIEKDHQAVNTQLRAAMAKVESSGADASVEALLNALSLATQVCVCACGWVCVCVAGWVGVYG